MIVVLDFITTKYASILISSFVLPHLFFFEKNWGNNEKFFLVTCIVLFCFHLVLSFLQQFRCSAYKTIKYFAMRRNSENMEQFEIVTGVLLDRLNIPHCKE